MERALNFVASLLFLSACSSSGSPLPSPSVSALTASASATASAARASSAAASTTSVSPAESPTPSRPVPGGLAVGRIAEVVTTDLVVRSLPEISDASIIDPSTVPFGFLAYVVDGPVAADGYDWYQVALFPPTLSDVVEEHPAFGWLAAAGKGGEPWIAPWKGDCPQPNWDGIKLSQRFLMLTCWSGLDITLEGTLQCDGSSQPGNEPAWLWTVPCWLEGPDYGQLLAGGLGLHFAPDFAPDIHATAGEGTKVRVTGHLDDPAAATCTEEPFPGTEPAHPDLVKLWCRLNFVVTEVLHAQS
jgi:hypothetical protein